MSIVKQLRDYYADEWKISSKGGRFQARWSDSVEKLVDSAIHAFGDYEECVEIDTDKLLETAKSEKAVFLMNWNFETGEYDFELEGVQNQELEEYLLNRLERWAKMAIDDIEVA